MRTQEEGRQKGEGKEGNDGVGTFLVPKTGSTKTTCEAAMRFVPDADLAKESIITRTVESYRGERKAGVVVREEEGRW